MRRCCLLFCLLGGLMMPAVAQALEETPEFVLLEVRLDQYRLSEAIPAYRQGERIFLPLGELAQLLTLAIDTQPEEGTASGYVLSEARGLALNANSGTVTKTGRRESFDASQVMSDPDDLYVAAELLEQWLPLQLNVDYARLRLTVTALEELPLQGRLARERRNNGTRRGAVDGPDYPPYPLRYRLIDLPSIDQTLSLEHRHNEHGDWSSARYTALLAGDLLYHESAIYLQAGTREPVRDARITLGRKDPDAGLLGPLQARSYRFGHVSGTGADHITTATAGLGVTVSNIPLTQASRFDSQTFEGELPPGWDVELYYNDTLVGYQQVDVDGRYRFEDQPLSYGRNDFRLVFNGPLGQTRTERQSFSLAQSMVRPGEFQYSVAGQQAEEGPHRASAQVRLGLTRSLTGSVGLVRDPINGNDEVYLTTGLRSFWQTVSLGGDFIQAQSGGSLVDLSAQTRIGRVALNGSRLYLDDFVSNRFPESADPIRTRDHVRVSLPLPLTERIRLPLTVTANRDTRYSGMARNTVSARLSANVYRATLTNTLNWRTSANASHTSGTLQFSRRVRATSVRGQMDYALGPDPKITSLGLSANRSLANGYRMTAGIGHSMATQETRYTAGVNKSLGYYGMGLNAGVQDSGAFTVGVRLFSAAARNPHRADWVYNARPMANSGAVSVRLFVDDNDNGVLDPGEQPLEGVGFMVNNTRHKARTDAAGVAHIGQLPVNRPVNIGVDKNTLMDPQWLPSTEGLKILPRPGRIARINLPVRVATEIDGTVYRWDNGDLRAISGVQLELQNANNETVARGTSSWDGFYIIPDVVAGDYWLRVAPDQLRRLDLEDTGTRKLHVSGDGMFISGVNLTVMSSTPWPSRQTEPRAAIPEQSGFRREPWITQQPSMHFTIQLMAASTEGLVQRYIERHDLTETSAYFHSIRNGLPWYSVVYGRFATYGEAELALAQLPSGIVGAAPWVRQFSEIQEGFPGT